MRQLSLWCALACGACGGTGSDPGSDLDAGPGSAAGSGFHYTATISVDSNDAPEVESFTVDGTPMASGAIVVRSYASLDAARAMPIAVVAMTGSGEVAFELAPTMCGDDVCNSSVPSCVGISSEDEEWLFHHSPFALTAGPLELDPDEGHCTLQDGQVVAWAD